MDQASASELQMLEDSALRWVRDAAGPLSPDDRWAQMAGFGWLGISLPESCDGLGQGLAEVCALARALGTGPISDPLGPVVVQAGGLLARCASPEQQQRWLAPIARGASRLVPAVQERGQTWREERFATRVQSSGPGWVLDGEKALVAGGDRADAFVVAASPHSAEGPPLWIIVPRDAPGVSVHPVPTVDGLGAARLRLSQVRLDAAHHLARVTLADWHHVCDDALLVACAESSGAMDTLLKTTAAYLRTRVQFGKPLAANQALRHRMADLAVACEEARSMVQSGVHGLTDPAALPAERARKAAGVRAKVGLLARRVCEEAIQLHGGMGVTEELAVGVFLRRQIALDALLGPPEWHLRRHAQMRTTVLASAAPGGSASVHPSQEA